jgi:HTH-type transcriptional regulator/antitoxin HipB
MSPFGYHEPSMRQSGTRVVIRNSSDFGALIRERRIKLGLDQISLAKKAGTSRKWLIEVESGKPRAEIGLILRTLNALGIALAFTDTAPGGSPARTKTLPGAVKIDRVIDSLKKPR